MQSWTVEVLILGRQGTMNSPMAHATKKHKFYRKGSAASVSRLIMPSILAISCFRRVMVGLLCGPDYTSILRLLQASETTCLLIGELDGVL
jgi:hypothetical protein